MEYRIGHLAYRTGDMKAALDAGGYDNVTIVLIDFTGESR